MLLTPTEPARPFCFCFLFGPRFFIYAFFPHERIRKNKVLVSSKKEGRALHEQEPGLSSDSAKHSQRIREKEEKVRSTRCTSATVLSRRRAAEKKRGNVMHEQKKKREPLENKEKAKVPVVHFASRAFTASWARRRALFSRRRFTSLRKKARICTFVPVRAFTRRTARFRCLQASPESLA